MSLDRRIDPLTGDYVSAPGGGFVETEVLEVQVVTTFLTAFGRWEGDATYGHRFAELARAVDSQENRQRLADLGRDALAWLVQDGSLERVTVDVESIENGRVAFQVNAYKPDGTTVRLPPIIVPVGAEP